MISLWHPARSQVPGGSAANVAKGLALLAAARPEPRRHRVRFVGMIGQDALGSQYAAGVRAAGVDPCLVTAASQAPTAQCLCMVTCDAQRTMRTHLGAATELRDGALLPAGWDAGLQLLHCEGYCLYRPDLARVVMRRARAVGATVSLDLASFEVVSNCLGALTSILEEGLVDILFSNEQEAERLADIMRPEGERMAQGSYHTHGEGSIGAGWVDAAQAHVLRYCRVSVVSMGAKGCVARDRDGGRGAAPANSVPVVDTTGAGDCFTAGFLHAFIAGAPLDRCCQLACEAGGEAVQVVGAELTEASRKRLLDCAAGL